MMERLTERQCCGLLGSLIGGLLQMAEREDVRRAVEWWAKTDQAWSMLPTAAEAEDFARRQAKKLGIG
jgi:hypothetical protein